MWAIKKKKQEFLAFESYKKCFFFFTPSGQQVVFYDPCTTMLHKNPDPFFSVLKSARPCCYFVAKEICLRKGVQCGLT
jgi:hypothetical protein